VKRPVVRIYIENQDGVSVEDCERVSRQISSVMDVENPIRGEYVLEVSSPGMDRPLFTLAQFERFTGSDVSVRLRLPYEGRRKFKGRLLGIEGNDVVILADEHEYLFPVESIDKANIIPSF
ncbi:MAG: ribosome maturation factor RimP, partial [bacterium]